MPGAPEGVGTKQLLWLVNAVIAEGANVLNESDMATVRGAPTAGLPSGGRDDLDHEHFLSVVVSPSVPRGSDI